VLPAKEIIAVHVALGEDAIVQSINFNESEGIVRFAVIVREQLTIAERVARVRELEYFTGVDYFGHGTGSASSFDMYFETETDELFPDFTFDDFFEYNSEDADENEIVEYAYFYEVITYLPRGVSDDE
jgi:hypothetical protein